MTETGDRGQILKRGDEFLSLYQKVESFTRELVQENERLRFLVASLQQENKDLGVSHPAGQDLADVVQRLESEKEELIHRYRAVEQENVDFARRYVEIEEENNNLANLYVASYQLHSTLEFKEVLQIVREIIINLVGADVFAVYLEQKRGEFTAVVTEGIEESALPAARAGEGVLGSHLVDGSGVYVAPDLESTDGATPLVIIPLSIKDQLIGAIVIYQLLQQKKEFTALDVELFNLLGGHAATAIFGAKLYSESRRKLNTIQGFLELLKPEPEQGVREP